MEKLLRNFIASLEKTNLHHIRPISDNLKFPLDNSFRISLGYSKPDELPVTISDMMKKVLTDQPIAPGEGILHHAEGVDLMPANIELAGMEMSLFNAMSWETVLRQYLPTF